MDTPRHLTVPTPGIDLAVEVTGTGPTIVALHGFPDTLRTWDGAIPRLVAAGWSVANVALRGYPPSDLARDGYSVAALAADVVAVADALKADRVAVLGHDWGATAGYAAAALFPDRIAGLIALAEVPPQVSPTGWRERLARPHNLYLRQTRPAAAILRRGWTGGIAGYWRRWSPGWTPDPDHLARVEAALAAPDRMEAAVAYYDQPEAPGALDRRLVTPVLSVHGTREPPTRRAAYAIARPWLGPGSRVIGLDGVGHWPHLEAPDRVVDETIAFLRGIVTIR
ncbi:MAG: alpha/beta hydrolase [Pseudomonadota bacterium]